MLACACLFALTAVATLATWRRACWLAERPHAGAWRFVRWVAAAGAALALFAVGVYARDCGEAFVATTALGDPAQHASFLAAGVDHAGTHMLPLLGAAWLVLALAVALARRGQKRLGYRNGALSAF